MQMTPRAKHMAIGGALGALGLAVGYGIFRSRKEILRPVFPVKDRGEYGLARREKHEKRKKHKHHEENDRGEYGRKRAHKEHGRGG